MNRPTPIFISVLFLLFFASNAAGQPTLKWVRAINTLDNYPYPTIKYTQNNFILYGTFRDSFDLNPDPWIQEPGVFGFGSEDLYLAQLSPEGEYEWLHALGGEDDDIAFSLATDSEGNIYISGSSWDLETFDFDPSPTGEFFLSAQNDGRAGFLAKYDKDGHFLKAVPFAAAPLYIASDTLYVIGNFKGRLDLDFSEDSLIIESASSSETDVFFAKYDKGLNLLFGKHLSSPGYIFSNLIRIDQHRNIYLGGTFSATLDLDPSEDTFLLTTGDPQKEAIYLAKYDPQGRLLWGYQIDGRDDGELLVGLFTDIDGEDLIISGNFFDNLILPDSTELTSAGRNDDFIARLGPDGRTKWHFTISGPGFTNMTSISEADTSFWTAGTFNDIIDMDPSPSAEFILGRELGSNFYLARYSYNGHLLEAYSIGPVFDHTLMWMQCDPASHKLLLNGTYFPEWTDFDLTTGIVKVPNKFAYAGFLAEYSTQMASSVGADRSIEEKEIRVFPNPTSGSINLQLPPGLRGELRLEVFTATGQRIWAQVIGATDQVVDLSPLPSGLYFMRLSGYQFNTGRKILIVR